MVSLRMQYLHVPFLLACLLGPRHAGRGARHLMKRGEAMR